MLRCGIIGAGFFSANHLNGWSMVDGVEIVALCDTDPSRLAKMGDAFGIEARYTDAAAMLDSEELDFVDVVTTVPSHRALVELAIGKDAHVICQKPLAATLEDARAMVRAADMAGKTLMVHENFRWQSPVRAVIDTLRSGTIGEPFFAVQPSGPATTYFPASPTWRKANASSSRTSVSMFWISCGL